MKTEFDVPAEKFQLAQQKRNETRILVDTGLRGHREMSRSRAVAQVGRRAGIVLSKSQANAAVEWRAQ